MPDLQFSIKGAEPAEHGLTPLLQFKLALSNVPPEEPIESISLHAQIQFECPKRIYNPREKRRLFDLFGTPERWGETLRNRLWTQVDCTVPGFIGRTEVLLNVPCTYDLKIASAKYLHALEEGDVPLLFLFSGAVFYRDAEGKLQAQRISWDKEHACRIPIRTWRALMDHHYPNSVWLYLDRDVFDRLAEFRRQRGLGSWEIVIENLLAQAREEVEA